MGKGGDGSREETDSADHFDQDRDRVHWIVAAMFSRNPAKSYKPRKQIILFSPKFLHVAFAPHQGATLVHVPSRFIKIA